MILYSSRSAKSVACNRLNVMGVSAFFFFPAFVAAFTRADELHVAGRSQLEQVVVAAIVQLDAGDRLRMAAVEAFRQAEDRRERPHDAPIAAAQLAVCAVLALRGRLPVVTGDERDDIDLLGF